MTKCIGNKGRRNTCYNQKFGCDVSIRMIQLCDMPIVKPVKYLFESSSTADIFLENWKKGNTIPVHKKKARIA